jgi:PelA/Pel-15E family pectate lyase
MEVVRREEVPRRVPNFDNDATADELRFLARVYNATKDERYRRAFVKGLDYGV